MPAWVVDASVAVKWFLREPDSDKANRLIFEPHDLIAPDLVLIELGNALGKAIRAGVVDLAFAEKSLATVPRMFRQLMPSGQYLAEAMRIATAHRHAIYDCIYLAASRHLGTPLITADTAFISKLTGSGPLANVISLAGWQP